MLISIIIPVYNRAAMVKATLDSVKRQTHRPIQLVLVDNNSTDNTLQVLQNFKTDNETQDFKIEVIEEKKQGASIARNTGARLAKGEWLMFFDSDDTMDDCLVAKYVEKIKENDVDLVCTTIEYIYKKKKIRSFLAYDNFLINHIFHACLSTERYILRKSLFEYVGGWDESLTYWDDWELGIRLLLKKPKIRVVDDGIYVHVNVHDKSITGSTYSSRVCEARKAILKAMQDSELFDYKNKIYLWKLLLYRKVLLAGLYNKEGENDLGESMFNEVTIELSSMPILRFFYWVMYKYVSLGGRGSQRIVKYLVR